MYATLALGRNIFCQQRHSLHLNLKRAFYNGRQELFQDYKKRVQKSFITNKYQRWSTQAKGGSGSAATGGTATNAARTKITTGFMVRNMLQFVWPKNNPHAKRLVIFALGLLLASKLINVGVPFIFKYAVDFINEKTPLTNVDEDQLKHYVTVCLALMAGYAIARFSASAFSELRNAIFASVAQGSIRDLAKQVFSHLHNLDLSFHLSRQTGALSKAIDRGTRGISFVLTSLVFNIAPTLLEVILVSSILATKFGFKYAAVSIGCITTYILFTFAITQWRTQFRIAMNRADNEAGNKAIDSLINYETVKYFNNENYEVKRYDESLKKYEVAAIKTTSSLAVLNAGQNAIFSGGLGIIMYLASQGILGGEMTIGDLVMCNALLFQLSLPLNFLGTIYREVKQSLVDMQELFLLTSIEAKIKNKAIDVPNLILSPAQSSIVFDNVTFGYIPGSNILEKISIEIPSGKKVAIVGGSGSGKSTVVRLLYRFYDPIEGRVLINNQDIRDVSLDSLRKAIGVVPQDTVLFHDSILYNLKYGNMNANLDTIHQAAKDCDLHNAIMKMPKKYETIVGERGLKLSGGEKQRVAITRCLLKDPTIFVYDEATSSLDSITEGTILNSLKANIKGRTSIFIAHRLSTIVDADEIFVLGNGKVIERGSHQNLISKPSSLYYMLWQKQHDKA